MILIELNSINFLKFLFIVLSFRISLTASIAENSLFMKQDVETKTDESQLIPLSRNYYEDGHDSKFNSDLDYTQPSNEVGTIMGKILNICKGLRSMVESVGNYLPQQIGSNSDNENVPLTIRFLMSIKGLIHGLSQVLKTLETIISKRYLENGRSMNSETGRSIYEPFASMFVNYNWYVPEMMLTRCLILWKGERYPHMPFYLIPIKIIEDLFDTILAKKIYKFGRSLQGLVSSNESNNMRNKRKINGELKHVSNSLLNARSYDIGNIDPANADTEDIDSGLEVSAGEKISKKSLSDSDEDIEDWLPLPESAESFFYGIVDSIKEYGSALLNPLTYQALTKKPDFLTVLQDFIAGGKEGLGQIGSQPTLGRCLTLYTMESTLRLFEVKVIGVV